MFWYQNQHLIIQINVFGLKMKISLQLILPKDPKDPTGPNKVQGSQGRGRAVLSLSQPRSFRFSCSSSHWKAPFTQATPPLLFLQTTWRSCGGWPICAPCESCWQHLQWESLWEGKGHVYPRIGAARFQEHLCTEPGTTASSLAVGFRAG